MVQQLTARPIPEVGFQMTYEEYLAWAGSDMFSEWVDGEVIVFMSVKRYHQRLVGFLIRCMTDIVDAGDLGEVLFAPSEMLIRDGRSSREPDVMFVAKANEARNTPDRVIGPADMVVEIVSEDSVTRDTRDKFLEYQAVGVPEYWLFDSREGHHGVVAYALVGERFETIALAADGAVHSRVLPGFFIRPEWLVGDTLPDPTILRGEAT